MTNETLLLQIQDDLQVASQALVDITESGKGLSRALSSVDKQAAIALSYKLSALAALVTGAIVALDVAVSLSSLPQSSSSSSSK